MIELLKALMSVTATAGSVELSGSIGNVLAGIPMPLPAA